MTDSTSSTSSSDPDTPLTLTWSPSEQEPIPLPTHLPPLPFFSERIGQDGYLFDPPVPLPFMEHLNLLGQYLEESSLGYLCGKIIAIDGYGKDSIQLVINSLRHFIIEDLNIQVRTVEMDSGGASASDLAQFMASLRRWDEMVATISADSSAPPRSNEHWCSGCNIFALPWPRQSPVYILPISPLMITLKAANSKNASAGNYSPNDVFQFLARFWSYSIKPDITVSIVEPTSDITAESVIRLQSSQMNTMILAETGGEIAISPRQLRRLALEVKEWLHDY